MIKLIIWIIIGVLALSFFGISLRGLVDAPTTQENVGFLKELATSGWMIVNDFVMGLVHLVLK